MAVIPDSKPWYREPWPWILMGLPASVVVAGVITTVIAVRTNDGLVVDDYYKQGLTINQTLARDRMAAQMELAARLDLDGAQVRVQLRARDGVTLPDTLRLVATHPARAGLDLEAPLRRDGAHWVGRLDQPAEGLRTLVLEDAARSWRLAGRASLPARDALLVPVDTASTHSAP